MQLERVLDLEIWLARFDKGLGIVTAGNDTAIVVAQCRAGYLGCSERRITSLPRLYRRLQMSSLLSKPALRYMSLLALSGGTLKHNRVKPC